MNEITREIRFEYSKEKTPVDIFKEYTLMLTAFEKAIMLCLLSRAKAEKRKKTRQFTNSIILGSQASRSALKVN